MSKFMNQMGMILTRGWYRKEELGTSPYSGLPYTVIAAHNEVRHYLRQRYMDTGRRGHGNKAWKRASKLNTGSIVRCGNIWEVR